MSLLDIVNCSQQSSNVLSLTVFRPRGSEKKKEIEQKQNAEMLR